MSENVYIVRPVRGAYLLTGPTIQHGLLYGNEVHAELLKESKTIQAETDRLAKRAIELNARIAEEEAAKAKRRKSGIFESP